MNKIGFNLLAWSASVEEDVFPIVDRLKEIGYDGVEFFYGSDDPELYKKFGQHCQSTEMKITAVLGLGPETNAISSDPTVRQAALDQMKWAIDVASDMGCELIAGPFHSAFATFQNKAPEDIDYQRSAEILRQAGEYADGAGVLLTPEAINRFECYLVNTMDQMKKLLDLVDHPNVQAHYDTHHANIEEKNIPEAIRKIAPQLGHVHISENDRGTPGEGHIPFEETFETLAEVGYDGWLTIEAFTRNDIGFANSINVWREYSPPWEVAEKGYKLIKRLTEQYNTQ